MKMAPLMLVIGLVILAAGFYLWRKNSWVQASSQKAAYDHLRGKKNLSDINWQEKDKAFWKKHLSEDQYRVCRQEGTEAPYSGKYLEEKREGRFLCSNCGLPVFSVAHKYDSGTGWPSFFRTIGEEAVETRTDYSLGMKRTEVHCTRCKAHLGHVFNDGPPPTGLRYCINSVSLVHEKDL